MASGRLRSQWPVWPCAFGLALLAASVGACAGIVGADFDDVHGGTSAVTTDGAAPPTTTTTTDDGGSGPIVADEAGACPTSLTNCSNVCVDLTTDPANCGACAKVCPSDPHGTAACASNRCVLACNDGYETCVTGCCAITTPTTDSGTDAAAASLGIPCAGTHCPTSNGGFCCGNSENFGGDVCETGNSNDGCTDILLCGSAGDCSGQVCCYNQGEYDPNNNPDGQESLCLSSCPGGSLYVQFCNPAASGECANGGECTGVLTPPDLETTFHFCQ